MKRYIIWARCKHSTLNSANDDDEQILEFGDDVSEEVIDTECLDHLDTMIGNSFDTGWNELTAEEYQVIQEHRKKKGKR